jgi:hypothetical protein
MLRGAPLRGLVTMRRVRAAWSDPAVLHRRNTGPGVLASHHEVAHAQPRIRVWIGVRCAARVLDGSVTASPR